MLKTQNPYIGFLIKNPRNNCLINERKNCSWVYIFPLSEQNYSVGPDTSANKSKASALVILTR